MESLRGSVLDSDVRLGLSQEPQGYLLLPDHHDLG